MLIGKDTEKSPITIEIKATAVHKVRENAHMKSIKAVDQEH